MGKKPWQIREEIEETREEMSGTVEEIGARIDFPGRARQSVSHMADSTKSSIRSATGSTMDSARAVKGRAVEQARAGAGRVSSTVKTHPAEFALGAVGAILAIGVLVFFIKWVVSSRHS